ncbi:MAG: response regulator transcription factor [Paludibacteraceae bacterium]|nr:response regulator transcription factor [Paludibacteraceae bacterium]
MIEKILVVDDEEDLCEILQYNLEKAGYLVDVAYSAEEALQDDLTKYRLFLLDVMMGEISGFKLGSMIKSKEETKNIPIIYLTAKDTETDKLRGFDIGADDYISKPFSINEVVARVKAVLKRAYNPIPVVDNPDDEDEKNKNESALQTETVSFDSLVLNLSNKTATVKSAEICLTKKEFELLSMFLQHPDTVFTREQLIEAIWKGDNSMSDRTIDVNITRLRKKIEPYNKNLVTRQGYGYYFSTK